MKQEVSRFFLKPASSPLSSEDFRRTACTSLLQHVVEASGGGRAGAQAADPRRSDGTRRGFFPPDRASASVSEVCRLSFFPDPHQHRRRLVDVGVINTALRVCQQYLGVLEHRDIDVAAETPHEVCWGAFLQDYYTVVQ